MRATWNGTSLYLQNGTKVVVPEEIVQKLPQLPLEGFLQTPDPSISWNTINKISPDQWKNINFYVYLTYKIL
jgi:hypothetical protein